MSEQDDSLPTLPLEEQVKYWRGRAMLNKQVADAMITNVERVLTAIGMRAPDREYVLDQLRQTPAGVSAPDALGYATRLAESMWRKHYQQIAPNWHPFDDLMGVLTQIDNMATGLIKAPEDGVSACDDQPKQG